MPCRHSIVHRRRKQRSYFRTNERYGEDSRKGELKRSCKEGVRVRGEYDEGSYENVVDDGPLAVGEQRENKNRGHDQGTYDRRLKPGNQRITEQRDEGRKGRQLQG